ncbi:MAG TPA: DMT family transporter [Bellilinea sp.]|mgnify:CR=1 FL=1|nr:DMT family transporter [Bellilinea sp.]
MIFLIIVSLIWAFSFGLIKTNLTSLDPNFVAAARLTISLLVFLPFLRFRSIPKPIRWKLFLIGAVQYGIMYVAYTAAFQYLKAYEIALFTIFTPLYVTIINDIMQRKVNWVAFAATILAIIGTAIVKGQSLYQPALWMGFLVVQVSNLAFAYGQIAYKQVMKPYPELKDTNLFALLYFGGALTALLPALFTTPWTNFMISREQILTLVFLGAVSSGLCFFMWNVGARRVNAGTLAVFNDLKIPLAVAVSLLVFREKTNVPSLLIGGGIVVLAVLLNEWYVRRQRRAETPVDATAG